MLHNGPGLNPGRCAYNCKYICNNTEAFQYISPIMIMWSLPYSCFNEMGNKNICSKTVLFMSVRIKYRIA